MSNEIRNLMFDRAAKKTIYDAESDRVISADEADEKIRNFIFEKTGLNSKSTLRDISRAFKKDGGKECFELLEEILDMRISMGWQDDEFFNAYVESKNVADGDDIEFVSGKDVVLTVTKVAGDHHDLITQKLGEGSPITIPTSVYAVKVGTDIRLFLTGRRSWSDFIDAVAIAFKKKIQGEIYTAFMGAAASVPASAQFNKSGALSASTKATFDTLIEDVSAANASDVIIVGTKSALKNITALADVNWADEGAKAAYNALGRLGSYEGTAMIEIPQRFADNDTATRLVDDKKLLILPAVEDKFVKFVDYGETVLEETERGETMNDQQTYEVQRRMGVGVVITRYLGSWTLP